MLPGNTPTAKPPELWTVVTMAVILIPLAAAAFILSFQMLHPVMLLAGWSSGTAWLGPVLIDLAAAAGALMMMVLRGSAWRFGLGLLIASTAISIVGNLAGHNIARPDGVHGADFPDELVGAQLPDEWQWVVIVLSVAAPVFVAVLVHAFAEVLMSHLATRAPRSAPSRPVGQSASAATPPTPPTPQVRATAERIAPQPAVEVKPAAARPSVAQRPVVPQPLPAANNVTPIDRASGSPSQREKAYLWFAARVDAADGDVTAVSGPDIAAQFGADHLKKKISDFRQRYQRENAPAAVND